MYICSHVKKGSNVDNKQQIEVQIKNLNSENFEIVLLIR